MSLWLKRTFLLWLGLVLLFAVGRAFYLADYRLVLAAEPYAAKDLVFAFVSSLRFDGSVSAYLLAPLVVVALLSGSRRLFLLYGGLIYVVAWITVMVDHYFYLYFKDHFNVFFWEFFENPSNAGLVMNGLGDVVPLPKALAITALGAAAGALFVRRTASTDFPRARIPALAFLLFFLAAARGTLDGRPLSLQDRRVVISPNGLVNLLHTNPFLPLYRGYKERMEVDALAKSFELSAERVEAAFRRVTAFVPGARAEVSPQGYHYLTQHVTPLGAQYLQRQPKHVVVIFMESYASWILKYEGEGFNVEMANGLRGLKSRSLSFDRHFPPAGGTIKNIAAANLSIPTARDFYPSIVYHREGYKAFPGRLPVVMKSLGYQPRFFYGGVVAWHRLYQFLPAIGYDAVFAEHSFPELPHHENGLYDDGLFSAVADDLSKAGRRTFTFVMTLSNHPPYDVPETAKSPPIEVPASLKDRMLDSPETFMRRLYAFRYADRALERFVDELERRGLARDTLLVVTGDHAFASGVGYSGADAWRIEEIPLLFYGPGILKPEYVGTSRSPFTTHLDLMPSLAALLTEAPLDVQTFGKPVFADAPGDTGINHFFTCEGGLCLSGGRSYELTPDLSFTPSVPSGGSDKVREIEADERAYYDAAMHYLFRFQP